MQHVSGLQPAKPVTPVFERDGYVLARAAVDRDVLLEARRAICGVLRDRGWLEPSPDPMAAVPQGRTATGLRKQPKVRTEAEVRKLRKK